MVRVYHGDAEGRWPSLLTAPRAPPPFICCCSTTARVTIEVSPGVMLARSLRPCENDAYDPVRHDEYAVTDTAYEPLLSKYTPSTPA